MISLMTPDRALLTLGDAVRKRRIAEGLTQAGLSLRSGVALGTLRKFERTGLGSTEALVKLLGALGGLEALVSALTPDASRFSTLDEVLKPAPPPRKRGWRS